MFFLMCVAGLISPAHAAGYPVNGDVIGALSHYTVRKEDNLYEIARRFDIGIVELLAANPGVDPWTPEEGTELTITTMHVLPAAAPPAISPNERLRVRQFSRRFFAIYYSWLQNTATTSPSHF